MKIKLGLILTCIYINIAGYMLAQTDFTVESSPKYYTVETSPTRIEVGNSIGFSIEVSGGVVEALDLERSTMFQQYVPTDASIKVLKNIENGQSKAVYEISVKELLQKGSVQITDDSLKTPIILKGEILYGSMVRVTLRA